MAIVALKFSFKVEENEMQEPTLNSARHALVQKIQAVEATKVQKEEEARLFKQTRNLQTLAELEADMDTIRRALKTKAKDMKIFLKAVEDYSREGEYDADYVIALVKQGVDILQNNAATNLPSMTARAFDGCGCGCSTNAAA